MDRIEKGFAAIKADPAISEAMREALTKSKNVPADSMNYAEFGELPLDFFKKVCLMNEQDWMLFNECVEQAVQGSTASDIESAKGMFDAKLKMLINLGKVVESSDGKFVKVPLKDELYPSVE